MDFILISYGKVFASMGAAGFLSVKGGFDRLSGIDHQILQFQRLHQVTVPDLNQGI